MVTSDQLRLVTSAYNLLLDRDPEPAGLKHWSECLANGLSKAEFLRAVISSSECQGKLDAPLADGFDGVDLIVPLGDCRFVVPATDRSLVPYLLKDKAWEPTIIQYLIKRLTRSDLFLDVGANLGYYTTLLSPFVKQVVAFEPVTTSYRYCQTNVALNQRNNVELHNVGLWHREADLEMAVDRSSLMTAHIGSGDAVHCITLDQLDVRPNVVKIDIEGAEAFALQGMRRTLERSRPVVVMELNRPALARYGAEAGDVWRFFAGLNYSMSVFQRELSDPQPVNTLEALTGFCPPDSLVDIVAMPAHHANW
jgi:FkbM family methyltransferase